MRATKLICKNKNLSYEERLRLLNLPTLKFRRHRGDMIELYKIVHGMYDDTATVHLSFRNLSRTRGHCYKLYPQHVKYDVKKYFWRIELLHSGMDCQNLLSLHLSLIFLKPDWINYGLINWLDITCTMKLAQPEVRCKYCGYCVKLSAK